METRDRVGRRRRGWRREEEAAASDFGVQFAKPLVMVDCCLSSITLASQRKVGSS